LGLKLSIFWLKVGVVYVPISHHLSHDSMKIKIKKTLLVYIIAGRWGTLMYGRTLAFLWESGQQMGEQTKRLSQ